MPSRGPAAPHCPPPHLCWARSPRWTAWSGTARSSLKHKAAALGGTDGQGREGRTDRGRREDSPAPPHSPLLPTPRAPSTARRTWAPGGPGEHSAMGASRKGWDMLGRRMRGATGRLRSSPLGSSRPPAAFKGSAGSEEPPHGLYRPQPPAGPGCTAQQHPAPSNPQLPPSSLTTFPPRCPSCFQPCPFHPSHLPRSQGEEWDPRGRSGLGTAREGCATSSPGPKAGTAAPRRASPLPEAEAQVSMGLRGCLLTPPLQPSHCNRLLLYAPSLQQGTRVIREMKLFILLPQTMLLPRPRHIRPQSVLKSQLVDQAQPAFKPKWSTVPWGRLGFLGF